MKTSHLQNTYPGNIYLLSRGYAFTLALATTVFMMSVQSVKSFSHQQSIKPFLSGSLLDKSQTSYSSMVVIPEIRKSSLPGKALSIRTKQISYISGSLSSPLVSFLGWYSEEKPTPNSVIYNE